MNNAVLALLCALAGASAAAAVDPGAIKSALQAIVDAKAKTYNCSVSIAFKNADHEVAVAAGTADFSSGRAVTVDDKFAWGSGTKPLTGASILKLVSEGRFGLETPAHEVVDPMLAAAAKRDLGYKPRVGTDEGLARLRRHLAEEPLPA